MAGVQALRDLRRDAAITLSSGGVPALWDAALWRTTRRVFRRRRFLVLEHDLARAGQPLSAAGVEIRVLGDGDWAVLEMAMTARTVKRFRRRVAAHRTAIVAWRGDRPVGFGWISESVDPRIEYYDIPLPRDAVYCWDLWVHPAERGRGVGAAIADARLTKAGERGFRRVWRLVEPDNPPALRTAEKSGRAPARVLGEARFLCVLGWVRASYEPPDAFAPELVRPSGTT